MLKISEATNKTRIAGLDAAKIYACICVVLSHTLRNSSVTTMHYPLLYFFARSAIPIFFLASGFINLNKKEITYRYAFKKICKILIIIIAWALIIDLGFKHVKVSTMHQDLQKIWLQKGNLANFWFLETLIILYALSPILNRLFKKKSELEY